MFVLFLFPYDPLCLRQFHVVTLLGGRSRRDCGRHAAGARRSPIGRLPKGNPTTSGCRSIEFPSSHVLEGDLGPECLNKCNVLPQKTRFKTRNVKVHTCV